MRGELISKPDTPLMGFIQGAGCTAAAVGIPIIGHTAIMAFGAGKPLLGLTLSIGLTCVASLLGGAACAAWRLIQCWAYERVLEGPPS
jgi:hypothetical protein